MSQPGYRPRFWPRYDLSLYEGLRASIRQIPSLFSIRSIGAGGCGLIGRDPALTLVPPKTVDLEFEMMDNLRVKSRLMVKCHLIYVRPYDLQSEAMMYGFQFQEDRTKMAPVIQQISTLAERGLVELC